MRALKLACLSLLIGLLLTLPANPVSAQTANGPLSSRNCDFQTTATSSTGASTNTCDVSGFTVLTVQLAGTPGSVLIEGTIDGTNYVPLLCYSQPQLVRIGSMTAAGLATCSVKGIVRARLNFSIAGTSVTGQGIALVANFATSNF